MKRITAILFAIYAALYLSVGSVYAIDKESDSGAMLSMHVPETDIRVYKLRTFLEHYNSPASEYAHVFIEEADKNNLDWKFVASIAGLESTFCRHIPNGSYNCWGWGIPTGAQSGIAFGTFSDGITTVSEGLRKNYIDRGLLTIEDIGHTYAASPTWASRVRYFMTLLDSWNPQMSSLPLDITI